MNSAPEAEWLKWLEQQHSNPNLQGDIVESKFVIPWSQFVPTGSNPESEWAALIADRAPQQVPQHTGVELGQPTAGTETREAGYQEELKKAQNVLEENKRHVNEVHPAGLDHTTTRCQPPFLQDKLYWEVDSLNAITIAGHLLDSHLANLMWIKEQLIEHHRTTIVLRNLAHKNLLAVQEAMHIQSKAANLACDIVAVQAGVLVPRDRAEGSNSGGS